MKFPLSLLVALALVWHAAHAAPTFEAVRGGYRSSDAVLLDRHGAPLHRLRADMHARRGRWVPLDEVSAALQQALLLSEDQRFYEHGGVDWLAVGAAAWANVQPGQARPRGASTLTMQLAGLLDADLRQRSAGRSLRQKVAQAQAALAMEGHWDKQQILEAYLNLLPFRGELVGIDALARTLFGRAPHALGEAEGAIAAALVRAPNAPPARVAQRACGVLRAMRAQSQGAAPDCLALDMLTAAAFERSAWRASEGNAPHAAQRLLARARRAGNEAPAELRSTLDAEVQRLAQGTLRQHVRELQGRNVEDGAVVVLDNATGDVLAWVGSTGRELSRAAEVDGVLALRQPGSTLKPFLYAQAIAERRLTAASLLNDSPQQLQTASGLYIPQNYDRSFKGWVSVRTALASSLNVPAVRALVMVSPEPFRQQLNALGLGLREDGGYYGYSLALGSAEVRLLHLTNAYRALALGGKLCGTRLALDEEAAPCTQALSPAAAFIVGDILADRNARAMTFGTDSVLATRFWTAVKTGTSKDMRDNWAVGWSARYTVGVWVGNASGAPMWNVSGTSGAAPVWAAIMRALHRNLPSRPPAPPAGVERAAVRFEGVQEAARQEWFLPGSAQSVFAIAAPASTESAARITAPQNGTILALDPDIPPARQRMPLRAEGGEHLRWFIGEQEVGRGTRAAWLPRPGRHVVQLRGTDGSVLDQRRIEVRGTWATQQARRAANNGR